MHGIHTHCIMGLFNRVMTAYASSFQEVFLETQPVVLLFRALGLNEVDALFDVQI